MYLHKNYFSIKSFNTQHDTYDITKSLFISWSIYNHVYKHYVLRLFTSILALQNYIWKIALKTHHHLFCFIFHKLYISPFLLMIYCINIHTEPYLILIKSMLPLIICIKNTHIVTIFYNKKIINKDFQNYKANYYI